MTGLGSWLAPRCQGHWRRGAALPAGQPALVLLERVVAVAAVRADGGVLAALDLAVAVTAVAVAVVAVAGRGGLDEGAVGDRPGPAERAAGGRGGDAVGVFLERRRQRL